jgi:hypothetical protein
MQQYTDTDEVSFFFHKLSIKTFILSVISLQFFFHLLSFLYATTLATVLSALPENIFNATGLTSFAADMWLITILLALSILFLHKFKKARSIPLYYLGVFSVVIIILSLFRETFSLNVLALTFVALFIVIKVNLYHIENQEMKEQAKLIR